MKSILICTLVTILGFGCVAPDLEHIKVNFQTCIAFIEVREYGNRISSGSGIVIDVKKTDINSVAVLTAKHVIDETILRSELTVHIRLNGVEYQCNQIFTNPDTDAAILVFETKDTICPVVIAKKIPETLSDVYNAGYPLGMELVITTGILNYRIANDIGLGTSPMWICTAPTYPGNSGGGIFNKDTGELIGLSVAVASQNKMYGATIVPHIHVIITIDVLREWIAEVNNERQKT